MRGWRKECFWILRAASRSRAAVLEGMCRKIAFGDLQGLLTGEVNSKSGDFLRSGVSVREKRQALLQRFLGKFVFGLVDLRFFTCRLKNCVSLHSLANKDILSSNSFLVGDQRVYLKDNEITTNPRYRKTTSKNLETREDRFHTHSNALHRQP